MIQKILDIYHKYGWLLLIILWSILTIILYILSINQIIPNKFPIIGLIGLVLLSTFILFVHRERIHNTDDSLQLNHQIICKEQNNLRIKLKLLDIFFVFGIIGILFTIQFTLFRSVFYFITTSIVIGIIIISIFISFEQKRYILNHILKILILSTITTLAGFKYYYWSGVDTWTHAAYNELIATIGYISPVIGKEVDYPLQHSAVAISEIIMSVDVRLATILAITIPSILLSIVVFIIVRKFIGNTMGLIAFIIFTFFSHIILYRFWGQTTSYGIMLFLPIMFVYFLWIFSDNNTKNIHFIIYLYLLFSLCLSHLFSSFILLFVLGGFYLGSIFLKKTLLTKEFGLLLVSIVTIIIYWISQNFGFSKIIDILFERTDTVAEIIPVFEKYVNIITPNTLSVLLNSNDILIYCVLLLLLCISTWVITSHQKSGILLLYTSGAYALLVIAWFTTQLFYSGMAIRFLPYIEFFLAIGLVNILYYWINMRGAHISFKTVFAIIMIVCLVAFVNTSYSEIAEENPIWIKDTFTPRNIAITEIIGLNTIVISLPDSYDKIQVDTALIRPMYYYLYKQSYKISNIVPKIGGENIVSESWLTLENNPGNYIIFREIFLKSPTYTYIYYGAGKYSSQVIQLEPIFQKYKFDENFNKLYDNNAITLYLL